MALMSYFEFQATTRSMLLQKMLKLHITRLILIMPLLEITFGKIGHLDIEKRKTVCSIHPDIMNDHFSNTVKIKNTNNDFICPNNDLLFNDTLFNFITFMDYEVYNALSLKGVN